MLGNAKQPVESSLLDCCLCRFSLLSLTGPGLSIMRKTDTPLWPSRDSRAQYMGRLRRYFSRISFSSPTTWPCALASEAIMQRRLLFGEIRVCLIAGARPKVLRS